MNILLVDDCKTTRKLLGHYLMARGYSIVFAENGLDALEKISIDRVDILITDLNMPYMDGIELIKSVRANPDLAAIPILMITTENDDIERDKALNSGADGYMIKPVTGDAIEENIRLLINSHLPKEGNNA